MRTMILGLMATLLVCGCAGARRAEHPISMGELTEVVSEVKRQVSIYESRRNTFLENPNSEPKLAEAMSKGPFICGSGQIDFDLESVSMELTTTYSEVAAAAVGVSLAPVGGGIGVAGGNASSQKLVFPVFVAPVSRDFRYTDKSGRPHEISDILFNLRTALILAALRPGACMVTWDYRDAKADKGGTFALGISHSKGVNGTINLGLVPVTGSLTAGFTSSTGNTLTVTFVQAGIPKDDKPRTNGPSVGVHVTVSPDSQTMTLDEPGGGSIGVFNVPRYATE